MPLSCHIRLVKENYPKIYNLYIYWSSAAGAQGLYLTLNYGFIDYSLSLHFIITLSLTL